MIFRSLSDKRLKQEHYPLEIVENANAQVKGIKGTPFVTKSEKAFVVLSENIDVETSLLDLIKQDKAIVISDGNALR